MCVNQIAIRKIVILLILLLFNFSSNKAVLALEITSPFGWRVHPISGEYSFHTGTDIAGDYGEQITALWSGQVVYAANWGGYGNCIILSHGNNTYTLYGHCSGFAVSNGDLVNQGQSIAYIGSTGNSTGPHLHLEVWINGEYVDPMTVLP